jgi:hypothetical protein
MHWYLAIVCYPYLLEPVYVESDDESKNTSTSSVASLKTAKSKSKSSINSEKDKKEENSRASVKNSSKTETTLTRSKHLRLEDMNLDESIDDTDEDQFFKQKNVPKKNCIKA